MSLTYTDKNLKVVLHSWGRFRVTISEAVQPGDALSWLNSGSDYTVQFASQTNSQRADCFATEEGEAGDTIMAALAVELKSADTPTTGGAVTRVYFAGATDDLGSPLYLGDEGKPSSDVGDTYAQIIGQVLARDRIMLNVTGSATGPTFSTDITPDVLDGAALGTALLAWSDLFLATGGVINFGAGDVTITHSADLLTIAGGIAGDDIFLPSSGGTINFNNGDVVIRHSSGRLTITKALLVSGELSVSQGLTIGGNSILNGTLNVGGNLTVGGICNFSTTVNVSGDFTVGPTGETQILGVTRLAAELIYVNNIPTSDPGGSGRLWNNGGVMTISA